MRFTTSLKAFRLALAAAAVVALTAIGAVAQSGPRVEFIAPSNAPDAAAASLEYRLYVNDSTGVLVPGITCTGSQPHIQCTAPVPAIALAFLVVPGAHRVEVTAQATGTPESPRSLPFTYVSSAAAPTGLRITDPAQP